VLSTDLPITGSPWLMTGMASLFGRSNLASRMPPMANVTISNVPGLPMPLYMAGARMLHFYPVSIPYHGAALNITVQSYAGLMEFGITACRRVLSQAEAQELIDHLRDALREIEALAPVEQVESAPPAAKAAAAPKKAARPARSTTTRRKATAAPAAKAARAKPAAAAKRAPAKKASREARAPR
jgi:hypothetical protein